MTQKSDREMGGAERERERERAELWNTDSWGEERREKKGGGRGGPTLEKEEGFQFQTSQGMNGKTGVPAEKPITN